MSIARLDNYRTSPLIAVAPVAQAATQQAAAPKLVAVPTETEARGFALYVGVDEATAAAAGTNLGAIVAALRATLAELVPGAGEETYAAVALAPVGTGGRNVEVVRTALRDPRAIDKLVSAPTNSDVPAKGIVIDASRNKVFADGINAELTFKEFQLINYLVENEGNTISRSEIIDFVWADDELNAPNERTIDVHVRRLRSKIAGYEDIIRTVRGGGYRFDKHPDVLIEG